MVDLDWSTVRVRELKQSPLARGRRQSFLYIDDMEWLRRAYAATNSKAQFLYALLLYRHCRLRKRSGETPAIASRTLIDGFGISHDAASRALQRLDQAGLVRIERQPGSAYRVRVVTNQKRPLRCAANPPMLCRETPYAAERRVYPSYILSFYLSLSHVG
jgi:DNA-binding MarR family transcriptional regulator